MGLRQTTSQWFWTLRCRGRLRGTGFYVSPTTSISIRRGAVLHLGRGVHISGGGNLTIRADTALESDVFIGKNVTLVAFAPVRVGRGSLIAENVSIHSENHRGADLGGYTAAPVILGERCWVGAGVVITEGAQVGAATAIGANSVVRGTLPGGVVAAGLPATVRKPRTDL